MKQVRQHDRLPAPWPILVAVLISLLAETVLAGSVRFREGRVLVRLADGRDAHAWARGRMLGRVRHSSSAVPGLHAIDLPPGLSVSDAVARSRRDPAVRYAEPDYAVDAVTTPDDPLFGELWGLQNTGQTGGTADADIDAPEAWDVTTGSAGVVVAVLDTGIAYTHPDLAPNLFRNDLDCSLDGVDDDANGWVDDCHGIDTVNDDGDPADDHKHGTHVAGTIGAAGNDARGVPGVAWNVRLLACKFLGAGAAGYVSDAVRCLDYVKAMRDRGIPVVATNNSWGGGSYSQALVDAIDAQRAAGILFIAAAGNDASDADARSFLPGGLFLPNVIAVAATTHVDAVADFSNYGRHSVHVGAPGRAVVSTVLSGGYESLNGTSMAAPHVSGVAALLAADDPSRDWRAIRNVILAGGDPISALAGTTVTGRRLNAHGALTCAGNVVRARLQPRADRIIAAVGVPVLLAALHIDCATPNGEIAVTVGETAETVTLRDDGAGADVAAGDGTYAGFWAPPAPGTHTLVFPDGDLVTVEATTGAIGDPVPAPGEWFGHAVAGLGTEVLVGAPFDNLAGAATGAVYRIDPVTRTIAQTYLSPTPSTLAAFGWAVATDGSRVLVGAPYDDAGAMDAGAAYLFDATTGAVLQTFLNPAGGREEFFGHAVAFGPGMILVGAPAARPYLEAMPGSRLGAVYVFDDATGALLTTLEGPFTDVAMDHFGYSIAVVGDLIAVGAPSISRVSIFDGNPASPSFGAELRTLAGTAAIDVSFGAAVVAIDSRLAVGDPLAGGFVPGDAGLPGAVFIFDPATGELLRAIRSPLSQSLGLFGASLAVLGADLVVGMPEHAANFAPPKGTGRVLVLNGTLGSLKTVLTSPVVAEGDALGTSVAVAGGRVIGGAPLNDLGGLDSGTVIAIDPALAPPAAVAYASRCYKAAWTNPELPMPPSIPLSNALESRSVIPDSTISSFCTPASITGSIVSRPDAHLSCFKTKDIATDPAFVPFTADVDNFFGRVSLKFKRGAELCLPTALDFDLIPQDVDWMRCFAVSGARSGARFVRTEVDLGDRFQASHTLVLKPYRYCVPTGNYGTPAHDPSLEMTCYKARDVSSIPPFVPQVLQTGNPRTAGPVRIKRPGPVCIVSSRVTPPPSLP